jgi:hypothetical protein
MNYFIKRDTTEYGPYTLADLQKYVASGNILLTDLCRSEGLSEWVPVSQVIGNIPVPAAPQPGTVYGGASAAAQAYTPAAVSQYPPPPNLHWALVLLLTFVTCGLFAFIWLLVEGLWLRKVKPDSKSFVYLMIMIGVLVAIVILGIAQVGEAGATGRGDAGLRGIAALLNIGYLVIRLVTVFSMRSDIEDHFNTAEPIGLSLSGVMTFFFAVYYFQYHFTQINEMKRRQVGYTI